MKDNSKLMNVITIIILVLIAFLIVKVFVVKNDIDSITLNKHYLKLYVNEQEKLDVTINPKNASNNKLIWSSENPGIASVTDDGTIKGNSIGNTKIIVKDENNKLSNMCYVDVVEKIIDNIELNIKEINMQIGETKELSPIIQPKELQNEKVIWTSTNSNIVSVDENGKITAVGKGIALIKASVLGKEATSLIVIGGTRINSLKINKEETSIEIGNRKKLEIETYPTDAFNENIIWESSDNNIIDVDANGIITAKNIGSATIIAKTEYSGVKDAYTIRVSKVKYEVTYSELNKKILIEEGEVLGTLPTITKEYNKLLGWYTALTGGEKVSENTVVTSNMTLYPHWEATMYILPERYVVPNGYTHIPSQSYNSSTLKYKTIKKDNDNFYSLIWVKDAYRQLNSANNNFKGGERVFLLNNEISTMHYQNKGMIATNGSFTISDRSSTAVIMSKGQKLVNDRFAKSKLHTILTIGSDNNLKANGTINVLYSEKRVDEWLTSVGARNTWAITSFETSSWNGGNDSGKDRRTALCQVDNNNFVLYTGLANGIHDYMKELHSLFNCKVVANLDGGGSTGMFYKTNTMNEIGTIYIYKRQGDCCRHIADMLYFVEQ